MHERAITAMFLLIQRVVFGVEISEEFKKEITPEILPQLYTIAKAHDMAHIVAQGLSELGLLGKDEISQKFQKQQMLAVYRYQKLNYELEQICQTLEDAKIPFIPLKGSVIRQYYPEPWMRTSCNIDVFVNEVDLERAVALFKEKEYNAAPKNSHEVSLYSIGGVHIELHYETVEEDYAAEANTVLSQIWQCAIPIEDSKNQFVLSDEMFYFYHVAHMAKHVEEGGCGIRPFLDLWILEHCISHNDSERDAFLEQGGLLPFANACRKLSAVWFDHGVHDTTTQQMQSYILFGGVYGTLDNRVAVHQNKTGGKIKYIASRIFLPYDSLKFMYPILQKHHWLMPIMQVRRWFRLRRKGRMKQSLHELNVNKTMPQEKISEIAELLTKLGLQ